MGVVLFMSSSNTPEPHLPSLLPAQKHTDTDSSHLPLQSSLRWDIPLPFLFPFCFFPFIIFLFPFFIFLSFCHFHAVLVTAWIGCVQAILCTYCIIPYNDSSVITMFNRKHWLSRQGCNNSLRAVSLPTPSAPPPYLGLFRKEKNVLSVMFTLSQRQTISVSHYLNQIFNPTQEFTSMNKNNFSTIQTVTKQISSSALGFQKPHLSYIDIVQVLHHILLYHSCLTFNLDHIYIFLSMKGLKVPALMLSRSQQISLTVAAVFHYLI